MNTKWVYIHSETTPEGKYVYTVGFYGRAEKWHAESDHTNSEDAARRVNFLNGGKVEHDK